VSRAVGLLGREVVGRGQADHLRHVGSSDLVGKETITGETHQSKFKVYSYDPGGGRNAVETTNMSDADANYTYVSDAHGSVTHLLKSDGEVQASYGYDPYGGEDEKLTKEIKQGSNSLITPATDPLNPYRYTSMREDSGSGSIDMGARRFAPDTARFMSSDFYGGALADVGLATDPLTQNRYAFAGGNPMSYVETDGHAFINEGAGSAPKTRPKERAKVLKDFDSYMSVSYRTDANQANEEIPVIAEEKKSGGGLWGKVKSVGHVALDGAGMVPVIGEAADLANCGWYAAEGKKLEAGLSCAAAIPIAGWGATGAKYAYKYGDDAYAGAKALRKSCAVNSFEGSTPVLLGNGIQVEIRDVHVGDLVWATDQASGTSGAYQVTALIRGYGLRQLVEIRLGATRIVATAGHPFWAVNKQAWIDASELRPGDQLLADGGQNVSITGVLAFQRIERVYNLTVSSAHTYYAGLARVLVHNSVCDRMNKEIATGNAPKGIRRADQADPNIPGSQDHVHFEGQRPTLNRDGTWGHGGPGDLTNRQTDWLKGWGWDVGS
jgi:RHS repeat-associated protein